MTLHHALRSIRLPAALCFVALCSRGLGAPSGDAPGLPKTAPHALVVQNYYYALPGKVEEVYAWRMHASDVRVSLGLPRGRILRRVRDDRQKGSPTALADVIWECEFASAAARAADVARLTESRDFAEVEAHMSTLIREFRRAVFEPESPPAAKP